MRTRFAMEAETEGRTTEVRLIGRMDGSAVAALRQRLADIVDDPEDIIVIDCSGLEYMSSGCLGVLLELIRRRKSVEGGFAIYGVPPRVRRVFELGGLTRLIPLYEGRDEAMREALQTA